MIENFSEYEIREQVLAFMRELGMYPAKSKDEMLKLDGQIHRYTIEGDNPSKKNGAYKIYSDGVPNGWVQDWKNGGEIAKWIFNFPDNEEAKKKIEYFNSPEYRKKIEDEQKKRNEELKKKQSDASERARILFEQLTEADEHPYLTKKKVKAHGVRYQSSTKSLVIPLRDVDGKLISLQTIDADGNKRFFHDAPRDDNFFSFDLEKISKENNLALLCEGYATGATLYEIFGYPVVCAMTSGSLIKVANALKGKYPYLKIAVMADNDLQTEKKRDLNPGVIAAKAVKEARLAIEYFAPPFPFSDIGTDWNDYINRYGNESSEIQNVKSKLHYLSLSEKERKDYDNRHELYNLISNLDPNIKLPPQEFIGGLFPRGFLSAIVAPSGTGKTMFMQKFVSDLSIGGTILDGVAENEPPRKCLIFAGEAGGELLLRRGASLKWPINPQRVKIVDQYKFESNGKTVMLDEYEGFENIKSIIDMVKPDIIFFDTLMSFHGKDENKNSEMKPIIKKLNDLAKEYNIAIVLNHHSRKRSAKERSLSLNQDDVIGASIFNRFISLIVGIEPMKDDEKNLLVKPLKSWFKTFMPFAFTLTEDENGQSVFEIDLSPEGVNNSRVAVWNYLRANFTPGDWFSFPQILLSEIEGNVTEWQCRRSLAALIKDKKIKKRGTTKNTEYTLVGFYDKAEE